MFITQAMGKRSADMRWVVQPPRSIGEVMRLVRQQERSGITYVKLRGDIPKLQKSAKQRVAWYLEQARQGGPVLVPVEKVHDKASRRMIFHNIAVSVSGPTAVSAEHACILLNPEKFGMMFEECDALGMPLVDPIEPVASVQVVAPPRPHAIDAAELEALRLERERLQAEIEALKAKAATPPKPKRGRPRKNTASKATE